ncbi:patatin-like phospholipase RssA [Dechloromonas sp. A34]|uniref:patatin-like phospholipase RssA n=1 Tax=Dechloromonas sp. A34 TaxID=447588 RepID=UPI002248E6FF|nr:patatin-like phospholipase RssA [Dechloromonas sp. A34]
MKNHPIRIGLALGSGSARGWSHIGVIRVLEQAGISPEIICGTSIGSLVGAAYAAGKLDSLELWVKELSWQAVVGLLDLKMGGGLIEGGKLVGFLRKQLDDQGIEELTKTFACVATDLANGRETWLREGSVVDAVRASIAMPGLFTPVLREGRMLVDGGLVNPVPVSLCRAMGADVVIAVDLNWDLLGQRKRLSSQARTELVPTTNGKLNGLLARLRPSNWMNGESQALKAMPSMLDVVSTSLNIMQVRITQSRLAGEPADAMIRPKLSTIAAMDFHRAEIAIAEGERAARHALPMIQELLG